MGVTNSLFFSPALAANWYAIYIIHGVYDIHLHIHTSAHYPRRGALTRTAG
jgi:hypothetical protein